MTNDLAAPSRVLDIGVDVDGVLYGFVPALREYIHSSTGRALETMPPASTWDFWRDDWGLTLDEFLQFMHDGVADGHLLWRGEPLDGTVEGLARLLDAGHRVHIVTDRASLGPEGMAEEATHAWLNSEGVPYTTVTLTKDKTTVPTDVFIEDRADFYQSLTAAGVDVYLLSYKYNEHIDTPPGRRIYSFTEFVNAVLTEEKK